ncbi:hypothetical protein PR048_023791 [Dryococelus australis]|uniref:Uncharacterized protein n=1 Tax=Dryococelus australis TaxID=614101 RepID=A0ABQ9GV12_9NEOP|nr:hypothetical protein PR048_023791 [Dryococelus australis]
MFCIRPRNIIDCTPAYGVRFTGFESWVCIRKHKGTGAPVTERLACSPSTKANRVQSPAGSLPHFHKWESCRTMPLVGGFSRGPPVSPAPSFRHCSITNIASPSLALKISILKAPPNLLTHVRKHPLMHHYVFALISTRLLPLGLTKGNNEVLLCESNEQRSSGQPRQPEAVLSSRKKKTYPHATKHMTDPGRIMKQTHLGIREPTKFPEGKSNNSGVPTQHGVEMGLRQACSNGTRTRDIRELHGKGSERSSAKPRSTKSRPEERSKVAHTLALGCGVFEKLASVMQMRIVKCPTAHTKNLLDWTKRITADYELILRCGNCILSVARYRGYTCTNTGHTKKAMSFKQVAAKAYHRDAARCDVTPNQPIVIHIARYESTSDKPDLQRKRLVLLYLNLRVRWNREGRTGPNCVSGRTPYAYKGRKSYKETCIAAGRDWAAIVGNWGHDCLPNFIASYRVVSRYCGGHLPAILRVIAYFCFIASPYRVASLYCEDGLSNKNSIEFGRSCDVEEQRKAMEVISRSKICDCEYRGSEGCDWHASLLDWARE